MNILFCAAFCASTVRSKVFAVQVERTREEIRARLSEASAKASALGLSGVVDKPLSGAKPALSVAIESESSTSSWREGECTPESKAAEGDLEFSSSQKSLSRQLSDLSALSRRSSIPGLQSEDSNEGSPEYVSLLAIPEAAKSLVAVKSQTQFDSPVGAVAASPAYHRRKVSDAGVGCTLDLSQRFEAEVRCLVKFLHCPSMRINEVDQPSLTLANEHEYWHPFSRFEHDPLWIFFVLT